MAEQDAEANEKTEALVGTLSGPKNGPKTHYYRHKHSKRQRGKGSVYNKLIPAKPVHDALLGLLADVIATLPDLRGRLIEEVKRYRQAMPAADGSFDSLRQERDNLTGQITMVIRCLSGAAMNDVQAELERFGPPPQRGRGGHPAD